MGRQSTGAMTTKEVARIELSYLLKYGFIVKGKQITKTLCWDNGNSVGFSSVYSNTEAYINISYTDTSYYGTKTEHNYNIQLVSVPSNLGKGEVLYFVCPQSGKRCRILYKCYGSLIWKCREAYERRIYYGSQIESKLYRSFERVHAITKTQNKLPQPHKSHYKGKPTRLQLIRLNLEIKQQYYNQQVEEIMINMLDK